MQYVHVFHLNNRSSYLCASSFSCSFFSVPESVLWFGRILTDQNTQEVKNERFLISTRQNNVRIFGIRCLRQSDKRTDRYQTRNVEKTKVNVTGCGRALLKSSFVTSCVFWFVSFNAGSHLCFRLFPSLTEWTFLAPASSAILRRRYRLMALT